MIDPTLKAWMVSAERSAAFRFDLLTIAPRSTAVLRWTDGDRKVLTTDGRLFVRGPDFERSKIRLAAGIQVSDMDLTLFVDDSVTVGGMPALAFADRGLFDGAAVTLEWAYFDTDGLFKGSFQRFKGVTGPAELEMGRIDFKVRSEIARLNVMVPREVYQPACLNQLFDGGCGLDPDAWAVSGTVTSVGTGRSGLMQFTASGLTQAAGYFDLGAVEFRTGQLSRTVRTIRAHAPGGVLSFAQPWSVAPAVGDTFSALPGCNRTVARCAGTFGNQLRFRGTPFVPSPETVA